MGWARGWNAEDKEYLRILVGKNPQKRPLGTSRRRMKADVKIGLEDTRGCV